MRWFYVFYLALIVLTAAATGAMIERGTYTILWGLLDGFLFFCACLVLCTPDEE